MNLSTVPPSAAKLDVHDINDIAQLDQLSVLLQLLAEQAGQLVNMTNFANALNISRPTITDYVTVLERLFMVRQTLPWVSNCSSRLIKTPKTQLLDSGLLAARLELSSDIAISNPQRFGPVLETFVYAELLKLLSWSDTRATISRLRTKDQDEVDFVIEDRRGRVVGIEIKNDATRRRRDFNGLRKLQEAVGDQFLRGLILHDHDQATPISEKLHGAPFSLLWA